METILHGFNKLGHPLCFMSRMPIDNQKHGPMGSMKKSSDEINKLSGSDPTLDRHETEFSLGADRRDQVQSKPCPSATDHRGLPFQGPGGSGMMVRAYSRLIPKVYQSLSLTGQPLDFGILFLQPSLYLLRFLLVGTPDGTLRRQTQLTQQAAHRSFAQMNPKPLMNKLPNHFCRPKRKSKLQLQRIFAGHRLVNPSQCFAIQFRGSSSPLPGIQSTPTAMSIPGQPTVYRYAIDPQRPRYRFRALSLLYAGHPSLPQLGQRLVIKSSSIHRLHRCLSNKYSRICQYNYESVNKLLMILIISLITAK